jgi:hypothetical protein
MAMKLSLTEGLLPSHLQAAMLVVTTKGHPVEPGLAAAIRPGAPSGQGTWP